MIKKIIGILAALAIVALVVFTAIGAGTYRSMLPDDLFTADAAESPEPPREPAGDVTTAITE